MCPLFKSTTGGEHEELPEFPEPVERPLGLLLADLEGADPDLRRLAVLALGDVPEALPDLIRRVGVETDRVVQDALCSQLARHDDPEVVDGLIGHLSSDDAALRNAVAQVLSRTPVAIAARVPGLLADPDPDVRILTVMLLADLRLPRVEEWLTDMVRTDQDPNVVAAAIGELVTLVGPRCDLALHAAGRRFPDDPFIAFSVSEALASLDGERT